MDEASPGLSVSSLASKLWRAGAPTVLDVRRAADFDPSPRLIPGALRRGPDIDASRAGDVRPAEVIVYCAHGRSVSQSICARLRAAGWNANYLEGGFAAWESSGLPSTRFADPLGATTTRWITRERPKIDRIACPWLVRRFVDPSAGFLYVPTAVVREEGRRLGATPYDIPDVAFSHVGERCSFDAFLRHFDLRAPGLDRLATIVRAADTATLELAPQAPGLLAISLGLSANFADDHAMLEQGMIVYDALYAWCRSGTAERHDWKPGSLEVRA